MLPVVDGFGFWPMWFIQAFSFETNMVKLVMALVSGSFSVSAFLEQPMNTVRKVQTVNSHHS